MFLTNKNYYVLRNELYLKEIRSNCAFNPSQCLGNFELTKLSVHGSVSLEIHLNLSIIMQLKKLAKSMDNKLSYDLQFVRLSFDINFNHGYS